MVPIGILTHNRPVYLDVTLRSLSATDLPAELPVIVYDDGSDDPAARRYLDSADSFVVQHQWPRTRKWQAAQLNILEDNPLLHGIANVIEVVRVQPSAAGVVLGSCFAIRDLFRRFPNAPAVILLQDDVLLKSDWYCRLTKQLGKSLRHDRTQGLIAGMHIDTRLSRPIRATTAVQTCTAQCYLITRALYDRLQGWFERAEHERSAFDGSLCRLVRSSGFEIQLIYPYVCQHIGIVSEVRPTWGFHTSNYGRGRLGRGASPPYSLARTVRVFYSTSVLV
jgi:hypothetical protein